MYYKGNPIERVLSKLKREAIRLPLLRVAHGYAHRQALDAHSTKLPALDPRDLPLLEGLRREGALMVDVEAMGLPETPGMFAALDKLLPELKQLKPNGDNAPRISGRRLMDFPEVHLWGLNERLLRLIENYIELPIFYRGADVRREVADSRPTDVRQWHVDNEDHRMFRIIIYLNDVDENGGPFEYMTRDNTVVATRQLDYGSGFVTDSEMERVVPRSAWRQATGPRHFGAFADTCRVFHRAMPPKARDRFSITFSWTSTTPIKTYPAVPYTRSAYDYLASHANARQLGVLPPETIGVNLS